MKKLLAMIIFFVCVGMVFAGASSESPASTTSAEPKVEVF